MEPLYRWLLTLLQLTLLLVVVVFVMITFPQMTDSWTLRWPKSPAKTTESAISNTESELLEEGPGKPLVVKHCLGCHSSRLIVQNRMSAERWKKTIDWMQQTQGLWDLGADEKALIDYLGEYYAPMQVGRRQNLDTESIRWYMLTTPGR